MDGLGDENFSDIYLCWFMFIAATFIIMLVFMNLLIAIMGDAFGEARENNLKSRLNRQLLIMNDHISFVKPEEVFKGMKYIIIMSLDKSALQE